MHQAILVPTMGASLASDTGRLPCVPSKRRPPRGEQSKASSREQLRTCYVTGAGRGAGVCASYRRRDV